ncbi:MAG: ComEC/Rec2 family competence protein, partial [Actinomycetales bacterium]
TLAAVPAGWIAWVASTCSALPAATLPVPSGWAGVGTLVVLCGVGWFAGRRLRVAFPRGISVRMRLALIGIGIAGFVAVTLAPPGMRGWPPAGWLLVACDVGQGDGLVVNVEPGVAVVVDVGPDGEAMLACLRSLGVERVSAIVLTHFHADHVLGLDRVVSALPVGMVFANPVDEPEEQSEAVREVLERSAVPASTVRSGDRLSIGPVRWQVLWPRRVIRAGSVPNNASTVLLMEVHGVRILLPGDIEPEAQVALMAGVPALRVDVVKVPHHGSRYQDPRFAVWSGGRIALVSAGLGNDYGHPAAETLLQWQQLGAVVGRTDLDGDLAVVQRGVDLGIVTRGN